MGLQLSENITISPRQTNRNCHWIVDKVTSIARWDVGKFFYSNSTQLNAKIHCVRIVPFSLYLLRNFDMPIADVCIHCQESRWVFLLVNSLIYKFNGVAIVHGTCVAFSVVNLRSEGVVFFWFE